MPPSQAWACKQGLQCKTGVQIRDFIMIKGHNKNSSNTLPNQVNNIPLLIVFLLLALRKKLPMTLFQLKYASYHLCIRSPSVGLYSQLRKIEGLPYPEAVFDGGFFTQNPRPFYTLVRKIYPQRLCPTDTHKFFKLLDVKGMLLRVYTQNIDAIEFLAGLPSERVVEAHGTFQRSYCTACHKNYSLEWLKDNIFHPERNDGVPKCEDCVTGIVRPDVVFFGENLPSRFWELSSQDFAECDLLLVFGTSLAVSPFNTMVGKPNSGVPRVYINRSPPGAAGGLLPWIMGLGANISFSKKTDLIVQSDCDKTVRQLCSQLNWTDDLEKLEVKILEA